MKKLGITLLFSMFIFIACGGNDSGPIIESFTLNDNKEVLVPGDYMVKAEVLYFAGHVLENKFKLTFKDLVPGRKIGVCRDDICIPFDVGAKYKNAVLKVDDTYFVPIERLMLNLGEDVDWDYSTLSLNINIAESKELNLDFNKK